MHAREASGPEEAQNPEQLDELRRCVLEAHAAVGGVEAVAVDKPVVQSLEIDGVSATKAPRQMFLVSLAEGREQARPLQRIEIDPDQAATFDRWPNAGRDLDGLDEL